MAMIFFHFIKNCEIDLGYIFPKDNNFGFSGDTETFRQDLNQLTSFIIESIPQTKVGEPLYLSREKLLSQIGWQGRLEFKSNHGFPVDSIYEDITQTRNSLNEIVCKTKSGYLILLGSPGSGKSSLLTRSFKTEKHLRVIRYYVYTPDNSTPSILRGESLNFLHDISLELEREGLKAGESLNKMERDYLLNKIKAQLQAANEEWRMQGIKTLIIIDGLDHIQREQKPERSLLYDLPTPEEMPCGVIFLLGSQSTNLEGIPPSIEEQIGHDERKVTMEPLNKGSVYKIFRKI